LRLHPHLRPAGTLILSLTLLACAHRGPAPSPTPEAAPAAAEGEAVPAAAPTADEVEAAITRSEEAYLSGLDDYREGRYEEARVHFEECLRILAEADPTFDGDSRLGTAYRDHWENIQDLEAQRVEGEITAGARGEVGTPRDELVDVSPELPPDEEAHERGHAEQASAEVTYDIPMVLNDRVLAFADLYQGAWRKQFEAGFRRSGRYVDMIRRVFAEEGLPQDLAYMAHVESSFKPRALSRVRAYGLWQFMAATGRNYGLHRDYWVDERADPEKATRAAARYLKFLHGMFGDWHLAMAAYNAGENKIQRALDRSGKDDFWEIARTRHILRETKNFVPAILAAVLIYKSPEEYGFDPSLREEPLEFDVLPVDLQTDLNVLAECAGVSREDLRDLNPELRRNATPPDDADYRLRVPAGTGPSAEARLAAIPPEERIRQVIHVVRNGETLTHLARKYGTSVAAIQSANRIRNPRRIRAGSTLVIPLSGGASPAVRAAAEVDASSGLRIHTVRRGENPYVIARAYGVRLDSLLAWNGLNKGSLIHPGAKLYVEDPGARAAGTATARAASGSTAGSAVHVVRRGDTPGGIARSYGIRLDDLLAWNGLGRSSVIYPGQRLVVGEAGDAVADSGDDPLVYVVRRGDTLYDISRAHSVTVADLCRWNRISSRTVLHPGDRLEIHGQ
jgi:membrane-bound lytic murein transglycosylase D